MGGPTCGLASVFRTPLTSRIAIVDRPENALALELDAPEIMPPLRSKSPRANLRDGVLPACTIASERSQRRVSV